MQHNVYHRLQEQKETLWGFEHKHTVSRVAVYMSSFFIVEISAYYARQK